MFKEQRNLYEQRIKIFIKRLKKLWYENKVSLTASFAKFEGMVSFENRLELVYEPIDKGSPWGSNWQRVWFKLEGKVPESWQGKTYVAKINLGGEAILFSANGTPMNAFSHHTLWMDEFVRDRYDLTNTTKPGEPVEFWLEASAGQLFGLQLERDPGLENPKRYGHHEAAIKEMDLALFREDIWQLYLDVFTLDDLMSSLPENSVRRARLLRALNKTIDIFQGDEKSVLQAREILKPELQKRSGESSLETIAVGHAHLDTAWLWPLSETIRKCARTFSAQIDLIEKYPDYIFGASQPQHYAFTKQYYPELYKRIKEKVAEGRWELQGGMWIEADCNLIDGESMVRQVLYGKKFFRDEFGLDVKNLWIPDVFGYSAAMPQIMKKSGLDYLVTQKISWNQFNTFPHNTFVWRGIDGSEVITHFPPEDNYNSLLKPSALRKARDNFSEKGLMNEFLTLFGIGDGGGGATEEIMETGLRQKDLEGSPQVLFDHAQSFLNRLDKYRDDLPLWVGELYLELHRGTLTTQAFNKKMNRTLEYKLRQLEMLWSLLPFENYPSEKIEQLWKDILLYQFHDILPGSSINPVYVESRQHYKRLAGDADELLAKVGAGLLKKQDNSICCINTSSFAYSRPVELPEDWKQCSVLDDNGNAVLVQQEKDQMVVQLTIPAFGSVTLKKGEAKDDENIHPENFVLENDLVRYQIGPDGTLVSGFDKEQNRRLFVNGQEGNLLTLYEDRPNEWDAWDIDIFYENQLLQQAKLVSMEWCAIGPVRQGIKTKLTVGESEIQQKIFLAHNSKRLDFETTVDWKERHKILRVGFDVNVHSQVACYDIQYGYLQRPTHRNTSWDMAKFEGVAHKFVDLSDQEYGVALLNDCKYGHKVLDNRMEISLLRSPTMPDPEADRGKHSFTYSFLPHSGDLVNSDVFSEAHQINKPPALFHGLSGNGLALPFTLLDEKVILEVIKKAEHEDATILRLYEPRGQAVSTKLNINVKDIRVFETDLLEQNPTELNLDDGKVKILFGPFEIKTLKVSKK